MTLKEKFENNITGVIGEEYIAEEFAINFANWYHFMLEQTDNLNKRFTPKELIEMFKKERNL